MEVPESVRVGLANIQPTMHLRWNPQGKMVKPGRYNATGGIRHAPQYEPRWELWDTSPETGREYRIMVLRDHEGRFRQPGMWLVDLMNVGNPAHYSGNLEAGLAAMERELSRQHPNLASLNDADEEGYMRHVTDMAWHAHTRGSRVGVSVNLVTA